MNLLIAPGFSQGKKIKHQQSIKLLMNLLIAPGFSSIVPGFSLIAPGFSQGKRKIALEFIN